MVIMVVHDKETKKSGRTGSLCVCVVGEECRGVSITGRVAGEGLVEGRVHVFLSERSSLDRKLKAQGDRGWCFVYWRNSKETRVM